MAERALGAVATAFDVGSRQGAVDAFLEYPDGRLAAFEVTQLATDNGASHQLAHLLSGDGSRWPLPGKWWWSVQIGHPADYPRLRQVFDKIVLLCEAGGVTLPEDLFCVEVDADVRWLTRESSVRMRAHPTVQSADEHRVRRATITQPSVAAFSDESFRLLDDALANAFGTELIHRHVAKLARTTADERHLFVVVGVNDLPFALFESLGFGDALPTSPPNLPDGLTHLWLAPVYGRRFLIGSSTGWAETRDVQPAS